MDRDTAKPHDYYFPPFTPDAVSEDATMRLDLTPRTATRLRDRLDLMIKLGTLLALVAPVGVAFYLGYTMPSRVARLEQQVSGLTRGQNILIALQCLSAAKPNLATVQLECGRVVQAIQIEQAGAPRP
jgi:hypothetical protein